MSFIKVKDLVRVYRMGDVEVRGLEDEVHCGSDEEREN